MWSRRLVLAAVWMGACTAACSSDDGDDGARNTDTSPAQTAGTRGSQTPASSSGSGGASSATGGVGGSTNPSFAGSGPMSVTPNAGSGGAPDFSCAKRTEEAKRVPVDMYIMLDRSESMLGVTGTGDTKWDAIRAALAKFVGDPRSSGLGVGLQYFPLGKPGVPEQCTQDSECGMGGPCVIRVCEPPPSSPTFIPQYCGTDADCPDKQPCVLFGLCSRDNSVYCFEFGAGACNSFGSRLGDCLHPISTCDGYATCEPGDYAKPAVPIGELPGQSGMITASLINAMPVGLTPTSAALSGAVQQAKQRAMAEPTHRVIALLATDGLPTECTPTDAQGIGDIAKNASMGSSPISTYVVGVFSPQEAAAAQMNLDAWAAAGGTDKAFILDSTQDVNAQFLDALEKIRGGTLACDYVLPPSPEGNELDLGLVNVAVVSDQTTRDLRYVGDAKSCDKTEYGWHYDADPDTGKATKIVSCPKTCEMLKMTSGKVELKLGCKTMGPE